MAAQVKLYKPGQGMLVRWIAFGLVSLMVLFGCNSLYHFVAARSDWWMTVIFTFPVVDLAVTYGFVISLAVAALLCFVAYVFVPNHPRCAEFLIETEGELKKVNWPPRHEFLGSSFIVILSVMIISLYLMLVDFVLGRTVQELILK